MTPQLIRQINHMKPCNWIGILSLMMMAACPLTGQSQDLPQDQVTSAKGKEAIRKFDSDREALEKAYQKHLNDLQTKYKAAVQAANDRLKDSLEESRKKSTIADNLDEAIVLRDLAQAVDRLPVEPPQQLLSDAELALRIRQVKSDLRQRKERATRDFRSNQYPPLDQFQRWLHGTWKAADGTRLKLQVDSLCYLLNDSAKGRQPYAYLMGNDGVIWIKLEKPLSNIPGMWISVVPAQDKNSDDHLGKNTFVREKLE